MSVGGVFTLITNDGIQDNLLMNTELLKKRIDEISNNKLEILKAKYPKLSDEELKKLDQSWMPTFAEIEKTHILFFNSSYKPFASLAHEYIKTYTKGSASLGNQVNFTLPIVGQFVNDLVFYVRLSGFSAVSALDKVRYIELLGNRLITHANFNVQNFVIDSYTTDNYNAFYEYKVPVNKVPGYLRCIGQEIPKVGYLTPDPAVDEFREYRYFGDGPQTFKTVQPDIELYIPLLFWFKDLQNALPNFILPMNQTNIQLELNTAQNLVAYSNYGGGGAYNPPVISACALYTNHIFVNPEIFNIIVNRMAFKLIRVHRNHIQQINSSSGSVLLNQIKWPVENLYVGFQPVANLTGSQTWYKNTYITNVSVPEAVVTGETHILVNQAVYQNEYQTVSKVQLKAGDVTIYPEMSPDFYNNYVPFRYGSFYKTPSLGWLMFNLNQNPGDDQPSGHLNVSRERELYISYISALDPVTGLNLIRQDYPANLIVLADCINFLVYKNGNVVLRFST